ncbi:hypothetical protein [Metabacillus sp. FJAT-53654]|uniref:Uncharacterized protein n=1 Tax=Metabacillus rhizosphaerae TaxID=3117747 RepID=A0ABZ2MWC4_9BACI
MSYEEEKVALNYISRKVSQSVNEHGDELETIKYQDHYHAIVTICQDKPPYNDYFVEVKDYYSEKRAARKALKELYRQAYSYPSFQFVLLGYE